MDAHNHSHQCHEKHTHGAVDPSLFTTDRGISAVKYSSLVMLLAAFIQFVVVYLSSSVGLLADTIHNFGDAGSALPLLMAFWLSERQPTKRFTYGLGRVEDLAGVSIVLLMLASAVGAAYVSIQRLFHPQIIEHLFVVMGASIVGFLGNECAAYFRIKVGKEIGSAALVADGYHA